MNSNWNQSKLNIFLFGMFVGFLTLSIDAFPNFGELQPMIVSALLVSASVYIDSVNPKASLLGIIFVWIWIPLERLTLIMFKLSSDGMESQLIKLLEFSSISLVLCLWGLLSTMIARKYSKNRVI